MKIGIYGGSFDPIHKGHIKIAKFVIKNLNLDKLLIIPTQVSPFKNKTKGINIEDKINMINLVLEDKMEICLFEAKRNNVSYTIDTVKYLKNKYKNDELYLIIGSDNLPKLNKWKDIDEIAYLTKITVVRRDKNINKLNLKKYNGILLDNPLFEKYSSTNFKYGLMNLVDEKVLNYIQKKGLYLSQILHNNLSALRAKHSVACADFAVLLAKQHKFSAKKAYIAGLMHDITKELPESNHREIIQKFQPDLINTPKHFLHQLTAGLWLENYYKLQDKEIIDAIKCHTELKQNMNTLDKILFIADKICQGRKFPGIQKVRELTLENLEKGFAQVVKINYDFNVKKGIIMSEKSIELYKKHMGDLWNK
ncbi:nicotinate-nucleotide adenylyltransferase [Mycoplasma leonicaptivi]|uniref:nicotinate-nucleotide adenylyltransferase n=1 Tax=Mycoplasma leonicaptivi TaxID=36742 RepID=UPI000487AD27|nr:nicotinate-nucleotide adenylyltransferase [Mycoplasma leonicaptivi]